MDEHMSMAIFADRESAVRSYCRGWPVVFDKAAGSWLYDENGRGYLDFFPGAGALNYGHNNPVLKRAVEAALKLARKVTGRRDIVAFAGAFHGATLGALAATQHTLLRGSSGVPLAHAISLPYPNTSRHSTSQHSAGRSNSQDRAELGPGWLERQLAAAGRRSDDVPAAVIVEVVQGEGGITVARLDWLHGLAVDCRRNGIALIVDDVQMGCGRTGPFFSSEPYTPSAENSRKSWHDAANSRPTPVRGAPDGRAAATQRAAGPQAWKQFLAVGAHRADAARTAGCGPPRLHPAGICRSEHR
jgi:diaminobutyrate-2-oxoglutarate transaminase